MKNIPEERLSTIGKLIEVTREEKRNKSQKQIYDEIFCRRHLYSKYIEKN